MSYLLRNLRWVLLLGLVFGSLALSGCSSTEPANASERPWNQPMGWENGLPPEMMEGR